MSHSNDPPALQEVELTTNGAPTPFPGGTMIWTGASLLEFLIKESRILVAGSELCAALQEYEAALEEYYEESKTGCPSYSVIEIPKAAIGDAVLRLLGIPTAPKRWERPAAPIRKGVARRDERRKESRRK